MITNTLACIVCAFQDVASISGFLVCSAILGVHLIEPYLSLTYLDPVDYEHLIQAMQQLYKDLTQTDPLLDLSKPAFRIIEAMSLGLEISTQQAASW